MISLRTCANLATAVAAAFLVGACSEVSTGPQRANGIQPGSASQDGRGDGGGSAANHGAIDVRVLLDKNRQALLEVHAGAFNESSGLATPNGVFQSLQYTVYDASNHTVAARTVGFQDSRVSQYVTRVDLCGAQEENDDGGGKASTCATQFGAGWKVSVQAYLTGVTGDGEKTDLVRADGAPEYLPDIDLTQQRLFVVAPGGNQFPAVVVPPGAATTFSVPIPNNKAIAGQPNKVAALVTCVVTVDGRLQLAFPNGVYNRFLNPNAFGYVGNPTQTIAAGGTGACQFTLTLPAGPHTVSVTAVVLSPGDYDTSNNTTATFTVTAAVSGPPDVAAGVLQQNLGSGPTALGANPIYPGASVELDQWVSLLSGTPPGAVVCTITLTSPGVTTQVLTANATLDTPGASAACKFHVTFQAAGAYTAVSTVATVTPTVDPVPQNNIATNAITVASPPPSAAVTIASLAFTDPAEKITAQQFSPSLNALADTVHSGDLATYSAAINITSLQNATSVPSITCSATVDGTAVVASAWVVQTITNATASPAPTCSFKFAITENSVTPKPHTVAWSISTGSFVNLAPATATTLSGTINAVQRVDVSVGGLQVLVNGVWQSLGSVPLKQGATATLQVPITNLSTLGATAVNCGSLVVNVTQPTTFTLPTASGVPVDTVPSVLGPTSVGPTTAIALPAGATGACQYTVTAPADRGLISINLVAGVSTASGQPLDPDPTNNWSSGTLSIVSNGTFNVTGGSYDILQQWSNPVAGPVWPIVGSLDAQRFSVSRLALTVVPTKAILGSFTMTGSVTSGSATSPTVFGTGTVGGTLGAATAAAPNPCLTAGPAAPLGNALEPQLGYFAEICAQPASIPGYQELTVSYAQGLAASPIPAASNPLLFDNNLVIKIRLDFTLTGSAFPDHVTATITVPILVQGVGCQFNVDFTAQSCGTQFGSPVVTTP